MPTPRYRPTYRQAELDLICKLALRGESFCFLGIAGNGKANLVRLLRNHPEFKAQHFGDHAEKILFPVVDATGWNGSARHLWQMMLEEVLQLTAHLPRAVIAEKVIALSEEERMRRKLQQEVDWVCQHHDHTIMFVLDDFDAVFRSAPLEVLEQFALLRSAGNKERLGYFVYTKGLPHVLARSKDIAFCSKFYDLFRHNIYVFGMYSRGDTLQMLHHLNDSLDEPLSVETLHQIAWLSGNHPRLTKVTFEICQAEHVASSNPAQYYAAKPDIYDECNRIFQGLHEQEQHVAIRAARAKQQPEDADTIDHLLRRGLIVQTNSIQWFSPLMAIFLENYGG